MVGSGSYKGKSVDSIDTGWGKKGNSFCPCSWESAVNNDTRSERWDFGTVFAAGMMTIGRKEIGYPHGPHPKGRIHHLW